MKTKVPTLWKLAVLALVASFTSLGALAADIIKTNNAIALNLTNSWVGDVVPTGTDVAVWDATVTAARSAVIGGNIAFQGIRVTNVVTGLQTIGTTASSQLSLGSAGIDLSGATVDMTISAVLNYVADQPWSVASGRTLLLSGANVGSAAITASGTGTLKLGHASAFGTSAVTLGGGLTVGSDKATGRAIANNVTLNGDIGITSTSTTVGSAGISGTLQFNGGINLGGGNRTISLSSTTATAFIPNFAINSAVTNGNLYITNTTPGTAPVQSVVISGTAINCNFGLRLGAGVDVLTTASATLNPAVKLTLDAGSTFQMAKAGTASTYSGGYNQTIGSLSGEGNIAAQGTQPSIILTVDDSVVGADSTFAGIISSGPTTAISLTKAGGNILTLSGANAFTGTTTLSNGTLRVSGSGTFGAVTAPLTIRGGTLDINSTAQTVGAVTMTGGSIASTGGSGSLTGTSYALSSGSVSAVLAGSGAVTKSTTNTVTLTGVNTYSGPTTILAGTLALSGSGSISNTPLISVANGGIFSLSGLSSTLVLGSSQTLSNSASGTGVLEGNLNAGSGTVSVSYVSNTPSLLITNGMLTLSGGTTFKIDNTGAALVAGSYKIIATNLAGSVSGTLPSVTVGGSGFSGTSASLSTIAGELYLVVVSGSGGSVTTTTVGTSGSPSVYGDSVTFTATVLTNAIIATDATSNYVFKVDGTPVATNALAGGQATYITSTLSAGAHTITAEYAGDANYLPSTNSVSQTVNKQTPVASIAMSATAVTYGQSLASSTPGGAFTNASGASVGGSFAFVNPGIVPLSVGSTNVSVFFTPSSANYNNVTNLVSVVVSPVNTSTNITFTPGLGSLTLNWPPSHQGWMVQSNAVNLANAGDWHNIDSSTNGTSLIITIDSASPNVFYRLRNP